MFQLLDLTSVCLYLFKVLKYITCQVMSGPDLRFSCRFLSSVMLVWIYIIYMRIIGLSDSSSVLGAGRPLWALQSSIWIIYTYIMKCFCGSEQVYDSPGDQKKNKVSCDYKTKHELLTCCHVCSTCVGCVGSKPAASHRFPQALPLTFCLFHNSH